MLPIILIVCCFAAIILSTTGKLFKDAYESRCRKDIDNSCSSVSHYVENFMSKAYSLTEGLAVSDAILTMNHDIQTPIIVGTTKRNDFFELIYIQDMKGDQTARSSGELGNRANRWWFTLMVEKNQPFVSKSYYSVNTNMACASIFYPMIKNGKTIGIFATDIKLSSLQSIVEEYSDLETGKISFIIDGEGSVVAHPENMYFEELYNYKTLTKTVAKKDSNGKVLYDTDGNICTEEQPIDISDEYINMIANVMAGNTGSCEITDKGISYFASYAPVKLSGSSDSWSVITLQDKDKALAPLTQANQNGSIVAVISVIFSLILITFIARSITNPIKLSNQRLMELSKGDLTSVVPNVRGRDESAQLLHNLNITILSLRDIIGKINSAVVKIANGDFTQSVSSDFQGEFNSLATSLNTIVESIQKTMRQINNCSNRFLDGLTTFDAMAHSLADGTKSQANVVEKLSSALTDISEKIAENAENSHNANQMMDSVQDKIKKTNSDLKDLVASMNAIKVNSNEINTITNKMQDIASRTNLLSMNASVEAARAGDAGKGFSVLAEEIRSLALQCAAAVSETAELIEKNRKNVESGILSLKVTVSSVQSVSKDSANTGCLIRNISAATLEQSDAINRISTSLNQISDVIKNNSSTASESARTSLQMKEQAKILKVLLENYKY